MENIRWSPPRGLLFVEFVLPADLRENLTPLLCELDENIDLSRLLLLGATVLALAVATEVEWLGVADLNVKLSESAE